jgi:Ca2+-binding EF-hand superfamily protein
MDDFFTAAEKVHVHKLFNQIDDNKNGQVGAAELIKFCREVGHELDADRARDICQTHGGGDGKLNFDQFCFAVGVTLVKVKSAIILLALFRELDANNTGKISAADLHRLVRETGTDLTHSEVDDVINKLDRSGDDLVSFEEFVKAFVIVLRLR